MSVHRKEETATVEMIVGWADDDYAFDDHPIIRWSWDKRKKIGFSLTPDKHDGCGEGDKSICLFEYVSDFESGYDVVDVFSSWEEWLAMAKSAEVHTENGAHYAYIETPVTVVLEYEYDYFGDYNDWFWYEYPK